MCFDVSSHHHLDIISHHHFHSRYQHLFKHQLPTCVYSVLAADEGLRGRNVLFTNSVLRPLLKVLQTSIIILVLHDVFPCNIAMHGMQPLHAVHAVAFLSLSSVKSMLLQTFLQKLQTLHLHLQEKYRQQQQEQQEELGCHIIMIPFCLAT